MKFVIFVLFFNLCTPESSSSEKISNCIMLADNIEDVFDTIQIEAYESEIYRITGKDINNAV